MLSSKRDEDEIKFKISDSKTIDKKTKQHKKKENLRFLSLPIASAIFSRIMWQASKTMVAGSNCIVFTTLLPTTLIFSDRVAMVGRKKWDGQRQMRVFC